MGLHTYNADSKVLKWYRDYFSDLVGATIIDFKLVEDKYEKGTWWPTYTCKKKRTVNGATVTDIFEIQISQDEEANSSGWIFGLIEPRTPPHEDRDENKTGGWR